VIRDGRLGKEFDLDVASFTSSLDFDQHLFEYDILGSMAHALMLYEKNIIDKKIVSNILKGLNKLNKKGFDHLNLDPRIEDVHIGIEESLFDMIGDDAGMLHISRSRNDQVACDIRMWSRECIIETVRNSLTLAEELVGLAEKNITTIFPGYTHLQRAQPTTLGHHLLTYCDSLLRDVNRLGGSFDRTNLSPLGAGALATSSFDIDRIMTADLLGFDGIIENSMDAVSSRDFVLEIISSLSIIMVNLSRLIEELILWSTSEFGFIELPDSFSSTSSIMPQKKNPDVLEIMRARVGVVLGNLSSSFVIQKSLPLTYNRDLQELSPLLRDSLFIVNSSLMILRKIIPSIKVNTLQLTKVGEERFINATNVADLLVKKTGMSFRNSHKIVGRAVQLAIINKSQLNLDILNKASQEIDNSIIDINETEIDSALTSRISVESMKGAGSPASSNVKSMIKSRKKTIKNEILLLNKRLNKILNSKKRLHEKVDGLLGV